MVDFERLRFDFNCPGDAPTPAQIAEVELIINGWIGESHALTSEEVPIAEAKVRAKQAPPRA